MNNEPEEEKGRVIVVTPLLMIGSEISITQDGHIFHLRVTAIEEVEDEREPF